MSQLPDSIAETRYVRLGGLDQWVMIRGDDIHNPVLVLLHGGPGFSETGPFRYYNAPLERSFTVVYWDQRGAGKTFDADTPIESMTVAQIVSDLDELVQHVCARVGARKVVLFGHSWGSALGVLYAARFPRNVAAYVGSGQIGDARDAEATSYAYALDKAQRVHNRMAERALRAIGPPPYGPAAVTRERTWVQILDGQLSLRSLWKTARMILSSPDSSVLDVPSAFRAMRWTLEAMWDETSQLDLLELAPALQVPVFFFLGRQDHWVPPETSVAYFDVLTAPSKEIVWFEQSGHEPFMDEPEKFNATMRDLVRQIAAAPAS